MGSKVKTTTNTTTSTQIGEVGFTGQAGVDLATNLALVGRQTSVDTIDAGIRSQEISAQAGTEIAAISDRASARILESTEGFAADLFDASERGALIASNSLGKVIQQQDEGFNRLVGGAGDLTRAAGDVVKSASDFRTDTVGAATGFFDKIVNAAKASAEQITSSARGVADQASNQASAVLGSATSTIERLGPQTTSNRNIAFAGLGVAALAVGFLVLRKK